VSTGTQTKSSQPTQLGPYKVTGLLGAGGMGVVYRARDDRMGRDVAIKVLDPKVAEQSARVSRFEQEARAAGALNHPNLLSVYDVGAEGSQPYLVTELLEGKTLQETLSSGKLSLTKALDYAVQIARGIDAAHSESIVHRDLKPANIFITTRGHVKILDFGIAKLIRDGELSDETLPVGTAEGTILGTSGYMSPEQVQGKAADRRSDIFSFGVVFHEMLAGEQPFRGVSAIETAYATVREDPPSISELVPKAPLQLSRIVSRCLEKDPEQRFQTAGDLAFHLETITDLSAPEQVAVSRKIRSKWPYALAAAVVLALIAYILVTSTHSSTPVNQVASEDAPAVVAPSIAKYDRITFRRGTISAARFAADGKAVYYTASWGQEPMQLYRTESERAGSLVLGHPGNALLDISASGQLALARTDDKHRGFAHPGTLAVVPLGGGGLRELKEKVIAADFAPGSEQLAVVSMTEQGTNLLEYPQGTVLWESPGWISHPRISPNGDSVAFLDHGSPLDDRGTVAIVDRKGEKSTLSSEYGSLQGLAWGPGGSEIWFTAAESGTTRALRAVDLSGVERLIVETPGMLTLQDIASDGRVLLTRDDARTLVHAKLAGKESIEDVSWFDWSLLVDISRDGKSVYFIEAGEAAGASYELFVRGGADEAAVRLATDIHLPVRASLDGAWLIASRALNSNVIKLVPTGAGSERDIKIEDAKVLQNWEWLPGSKQVLVNGIATDAAEDSPGGKPLSLWRVDISSGDSQRLDWAAGLMMPRNAVRADGAVLLGSPNVRGGFVYSTEGEKLQKLDPPSGKYKFIGWLDDRDLLLRDRDRTRIRLFRYNLTSKKMTPHKDLVPAFTAGEFALNQVLVEGESYAYSFMSTLSELYIARDLK
jgi:serine/threonine protein kinase